MSHHHELSDDDEFALLLRSAKIVTGMTQYEKAQLLEHMGYRKELIAAVFPDNAKTHEAELAQITFEEAQDARLEAEQKPSNLDKVAESTKSMNLEQLDDLKDALAQHQPPEHAMRGELTSALMPLAAKIALAEYTNGVRYERDDYLQAMQNAFDREQSRDRPRKR